MLPRMRHNSSSCTAALVLTCLLLAACRSVGAARALTWGSGEESVPATTLAVDEDGVTAAVAEQALALTALATGAAVVPSPSPSPSPPALPSPPPFLGSDQPVPPVDQIMKDFTNCSGFAQPRTYIEGQAWFTPDMPDVPDAVNTKSMHLHVGACVPHRQWVAGTIKLAILIQRHGYNLPDSTPVNLKVEVEQSSTTGTVTRMTTNGVVQNNNWVCDTATDLARLCKQVFYMDVETSTPNSTAAEGLNILKLVGTTPINDTISVRNMETRIVSNVVVWNNAATRLTYPTGLSKTLPPSQLSVTGFPWAYTHAEYLNDIPLSPFVGNLSISASSFVKAKSANVTGLLISVDPAFHKTPFVSGLVIRNYTTAQVPNTECPVAMLGNVSHVDCNKIATIKFDTRVLDDTKWHKLFIRTDSFVSNNDPIMVTRNANRPAGDQVGGGTFSAVALIAFRVNNTGNAIAGSQPATIAPGQGNKPPPGFTPPAGVVVFDGSQQLPSTNATLNIAANNYNCSGWMEPRVYLEGGAWFTQSYQSIDYANGSQLLIGACLPHGQRVAGKIPVDILLQKRNFPADSGVDVQLLVQLDWAGGNITYRLKQMNMLANWTCATPNNCRTIISIQVDTKPANGTYVAPDGPNAVTVEASTKFNWGASFHTMISRVQSWVFVTNNLDTNVSIPLNVSGIAKLEYPWGNGEFSAKLTKPPSLAAPVSGIVPISFQNSHPINITRMMFAVDPVFGPVPNMGLLLADASPKTNKTLCSYYSGCKSTISLDTTKLCNGVHRLFLRSDSYVDKSSAVADYGSGTFSVSEMTTFTVQNSPQSPTCRAAVPAMSAAMAAEAVASGSGSAVAHAAAVNRVAWRAFRLAPEKVVMEAKPRTVQELAVVSYNE